MQLRHCKGHRTTEPQHRLSEQHGPGHAPTLAHGVGGSIGLTQVPQFSRPRSWKHTTCCNWLALHGDLLDALEDGQPLGQLDAEAVEQGGVFFVGPDDAADLDLRPIDDGKDDVDALHLAQFFENEPGTVAEACVRLPLLEGLVVDGGVNPRDSGGLSWF